ncbi:hypothetical protein [Halobaculum gomorrense]|uniref:Envelope protein N-terminal domain-containing protein n=1 Tax=Halobaculum gomorrense TaxID=43928 RepID=A0A1M5RCH7_9EURY|nr:hypothetical protein [Halobaculum gomorrense]SHH23888.1 hypothetical protein SAMN05443636_2137 [Halobaculum gomorrense]
MDRPNRSQIVAPLFALLLVFSALGGGVAVQPAAATHDCSNLDSLVFFASLTIANYDKCARDHQAGAVQEVRDATTNQTHSDIYNAGLAHVAQTEQQRAVFANYLNDTEAAAWMQAESAVASSYQNGSAKAVAKSNARTAIADYYAVKQVNLIDSWNATVVAFKTLRQRAVNESDLSPGQIFSYDSQRSYTFEGTGTASVTLTNGSTRTVKTLEFSSTGPNGFNKYPTIHVASSWSDSSRLYRILLKAPNSNFEDESFIGQREDWRGTWIDIQNQNSGLQAEVDPFVNNTWTAFDSGQINATDVISGVNQMTNYGVEYSEDSNLYNSVAALSNLGLDTPNLNGTGTMAVTYNSVERHGLVMAREAPNGSWSANTTYNASNISGPVFLVTTDGKKVELNGEFHVGAISSTDGSNVDNVTATKVVYKTSNTSELLEKMETIEELRKEMEAKEQAAADGSSGSGTNIDPKYLLGALAVIGLLAYGKGQQSKRD